MDWHGTGAHACFLGTVAVLLVLERQDGWNVPRSRYFVGRSLNSDGRHKRYFFTSMVGVSTQSTGHLGCSGKEVFRHAVEKTRQTAETALEKAGSDGGEMRLDSSAPSQICASFKATATKMGLPMKRFRREPSKITANTSAASIRWRCRVGVARGQIKQGDLICDRKPFGGGLAWGAVGIALVAIFNRTSKWIDI